MRAEQGAMLLGRKATGVFGLIVLVAACAETTAPTPLATHDRTVNAPEVAPSRATPPPGRVGRATYQAGLVMWRGDTGVFVQATQNDDSTVVWVELQRMDGSSISDIFTRVPDQVFTVGGRGRDWSLTTGAITIVWHNDKHWIKNDPKIFGNTVTQVGDSGMVAGRVRGKTLSFYDQGFLVIQH